MEASGRFQHHAAHTEFAQPVPCRALASGIVREAARGSARLNLRVEPGLADIHASDEVRCSEFRANHDSSSSGMQYSECESPPALASRQSGPCAQPFVQASGGWLRRADQAHFRFVEPSPKRSDPPPGPGVCRPQGRPSPPRLTPRSAGAFPASSRAGCRASAAQSRVVRKGATAHLAQHRSPLGRWMPSWRDSVT